MKKKNPYRYMKLHSHTSMPFTKGFCDIYFCTGNDSNQFKVDAADAGLQIITCSNLVDETIVIAVDSYEPISTEIIQDCVLHSDETEEFEGPFPKERAYSFPVFFEMWARQVITAPNLQEAVQQLMKAELPKNATYVDGSFQIDESGEIITENQSRKSTI